MNVNVAQLTLRYGTRPVLAGVDFTARAGQMTALVGPNGAGKSTLLRAIAGLHAPSEGAVHLGDAVAHKAGRRALSRRVSWMTQTLQVPFAFSALETVLLGRSPHLGPFGVSGPADRSLALEALECVGVRDLADQPLPRLSGGERQRVQFAMTLVQDAPVALFDEPTSAQDFRGVALMTTAMRRLADEGRTIVVAVHDLNLAARAFDRVILLADGELRADGAPSEVVRGAALSDAYDGAVEAVEGTDGSYWVRVAAPAPGAPVDLPDHAR